jgi:hypothetical protein
MDELSKDEKAINYETLLHVLEVRNCLDYVIRELINRSEQHDNSKLSKPELEYFVEFTGKLKGMTYGSDEYKRCLNELKPALDHHYSKNRHHPEYYASGIDGMTLIDLVEMFCDWMAATKRHTDGDIFKSILINKTRFSISEQLTNIFVNTATEMTK